MSTVEAIPKPGSYVIEWQAVQVEGAESYGSIRVLMKHSPWIVQMNMTEFDAVEFLFTTQHAGVMEQWKSTPGDWIVRSPHGRFWFMSDEEFKSEFTWKA